MYPLLLVLVCFSIYYSRVNPDYFEHHLAGEGGLFQWLIFSTITFASIMCFYRASILKPFRGGLFSTCLIIAGFVFLIFALDEISWGQLIFHYDTPEFIKVRNTQGEMNIRDLVIAGFEVKDIIFTLSIKILATLYFLIIPFFYKRLDQLRRFVNRFAIPLPRYTQIAAYFVMVLVMMAIPSSLRHIVFELCFYWILVLMMYNPLNDEVFSRKSLVR
jgi:hypothetical protein